MSREKRILYQRVFLSLALAFATLFIIAPAALAYYPHSSLVGPKHSYLALGDSLAFGFQPDFDFGHGYANYFYNDLKNHGVTANANLGCPSETSTTFVKGGCPLPFLRKYPYSGPQLNAALSYLSSHSGLVSPVTLDIGASEIVPDFHRQGCTVDTTKFANDLATLDANLTQIILPALHNKLVVNGTLTGDLLLLNYYDPDQNACPNTVQYIQTLNQHLANDIGGYGSIVDVFSAFGGAATPNGNICSYTWECTFVQDIHPMRKGYSVIASAIENTAGY